MPYVLAWARGGIRGAPDETAGRVPCKSPVNPVLNELMKGIQAPLDSSLSAEGTHLFTIL